MTTSVVGAGARPTSVAPPRGTGQRRAVVAAFGVAAVAAVLVAAASLLGGAAEARFEVYDAATGEVVFERGIAVDAEFVLTHVHSVTRRPVIETFSVLDPDTIALEELWFDAFGPNLPAGPEETGGITTTYIREHGAYRVLHHSRPLGVVPLRVGSAEVDHTVTFADGAEVRLLDVARRGAHVELRVRDAR